MTDLIRFVRASTRFAARLRDSTSGLALTEFAMSVPVLLTLGLFGLETANLALAHLRVSNIAMLTADNAARVRESIDESDVVELFTGAKMTGESIDFAQNGRIVLSSIELRACTPTSGSGVSGGGTSCGTSGSSGSSGGGSGSSGSSGGGGSTNQGQWIRWQRCDGAKNYDSAYGPQNTGQNDASLQYVGTAANPISAQEGTAVMVVEVSYDYQPIIPNSFLDDIEIRYESAFNVRQRTNQAITNSGNITPKNCNVYQA